MKSTSRYSKGSVPPACLEVSVCAERQHWPVSRQCSSEILSWIGERGGEPRNIFELTLPVYHGLDGSLGVFLAYQGGC